MKKEIREYVREYKVEIVGLFDTRVQQSKMVQVMANSLPGWYLETNYSQYMMGKIWVCWM